MADKSEERFTIALPGGRVARVPYRVLNEYVVEGAKACHAGPPRSATLASAEPATTDGTGPPVATPTGKGMITINIYTDRGEVSIARKPEDGQDDVTAHSLSVDPTTGTSEYHTDWEMGQCDYTDESGYTQSVYAWHRHPFGTEYTEIFEG